MGGRRSHGYTAVIPKDAGCVGEVLQQNGYMTAWIGKNHNTPVWETSAAGPFDHWVVVNFAYDGGGMAKGGIVTVTANGAKIAEGRLERTVPAQFTLGEGLDIGMDVGSPIDFTYKLPFKFTGTIEKVTIDLLSQAGTAAADESKQDKNAA